MTKFDSGLKFCVIKYVAVVQLCRGGGVGSWYGSQHSAPADEYKIYVHLEVIFDKAFLPRDKIDSKTFIHINLLVRCDWAILTFIWTGFYILHICRAGSGHHV